MDMEENKQLNKNEIDEEKEKLKQEINRLDIYNNCEFYDQEQFVCYFPNRLIEITCCFDKEENFDAEENKNYVLCFLKKDAKKQLQDIIMYELRSLLYPCIEKGYKVKKLDGDFCDKNLKNVIILNTPENDKNIGISIGNHSKTVSTNAKIVKDDEDQLKQRFFPVSGIQQINCYDEDNFSYNKIKIFDVDMDYKLIICQDTETIKLTKFDDEETACATFCYKNKKKFQGKEDIISFFSTLSFAEIEQVLQILNENLKGKNYDKVNIETVLDEIKNKIYENRNEEKKDEEKNIDNEIINDIKKEPNKQKEDNEINKSETKKNDDDFNNELNENINNKSSNNQNKEEIDNKNENKNSSNGSINARLEIEKEDETSCNNCITCLKQCWSFSEKEK